MNFPIKNLELHVQENALLQGERLLDAGKVKNLEEIEKNLWLAQIDGFEVEIQITPLKVRAATCECGNSSGSIICGHVTAALFELRKIIQERSKRKKTSTPRKYTPKKLTITSIIENAPTEELKLFLKQYAKTNKNFSIALKTRFAGAVPMEDSHQKYLQLLDSCIKAHRLKNDLISYRGFQQLKKITKELLGQVDDAIALTNYKDATSILKSLIEKVTPIIHKTKGDEAHLAQVVRDAFDRMDLLLELKPAPELAQNIWFFCLDQSGRLSYVKNGFGETIFNLLDKLALDEKRLQILIQNIDNELEKTNLPEKYKASLLFIKLARFESQGLQNQANQLIKENFKNPEFAFFVAQNSFEKNDLERALQIATQGVEGLKQIEHLPKFEKLLFEIHCLENNPKEAVHWGKKRFVGTLDFYFYDKIKELEKDNWENEVSDILKAVRNLPFSIEKRDTIANILLRENQIQELWEYVRDFKSIDLLRNFDIHLLNKYRKEVHTLYDDLLTNYLENYIGRKPSSKIRSILTHLYQIEEHQLAIRLVNKYRKIHSGRHSLMEELQFFN